MLGLLNDYLRLFLFNLPHLMTIFSFFLSLETSNEALSLPLLSHSYNVLFLLLNIVNALLNSFLTVVFL